MLSSRIAAGARIPCVRAARLEGRPSVRIDYRFAMPRGQKNNQLTMHRVEGIRQTLRWTLGSWWLFTSESGIRRRSGCENSYNGPAVLT